MEQWLRWLWAYDIKYKAGRAAERLAVWIAWRLPRSLVMWCYVRVGAHATSGAYGGTVVSELTMMEALSRWEAGTGIHG